MSTKTGFQVERIAFFSDAVFAIAITLMIIEVKPPHLHEHVSQSEVLYEVLKLVPMFTGVILSFIFIGLFWVRHHQIMKHVEAYTSKLITLNMAFLLTIVFLPFSTAFVFENTMAASAVPLVFYNANYILAALFNYQLFSYILKPANRIIAAGDPVSIDDFRFELLFPIAVYLLVIILAFISAPLAPIGYMAFGFQSLFRKKKKQPAATTGKQANRT